MFDMIKAIWGYRGFIFGSVKREFQSKYRNSLLGASWTVLSPLAMIVIYTVIFSQVMRARLAGADSKFAYSIYLCAGLITWGLFAEIVERAKEVFIEQANLLKKLNFPRLCLPTIVVANASLNFAIIFSLFTGFMIISGNFPGLVFLSLAPVLCLQICFSIGLGMTIGVLNVFFRDVGQFFTILLQFWFWLTPIVYPANILPDSLRKYINLNPMTHVMTAYQGVLVNKQWPQWNTLWFVALSSVVLCVIGMYLFRKHAGELVDEL